MAGHAPPPIRDSPRRKSSTPHPVLRGWRVHAVANSPAENSTWLWRRGNDGRVEGFPPHDRVHPYSSRRSRHRSLGRGRAAGLVVNVASFRILTAGPD
jgi:hypothetical protein